MSEPPASSPAEDSLLLPEPRVSGSPAPLPDQRDHSEPRDSVFEEPVDLFGESVERVEPARRVQSEEDRPLSVMRPKIKKKPGPPKTRVPPITKDDVAGKKELIRQIEGHWGVNWIQNYIPKIHRPLRKRKPGQSRVYNRKSEDNPMKWMPSVLKAVLMIAKIYDDKPRLKKIMTEVVHYRNHHTGNKKPQLVTTDFDVIEDVLDKGWTVKQSFDIRYKHLLSNRLDPNAAPEPEEKFAHLFREESDEEDDDDDSEPDDDMELSNDFQLQSGYINDPPPPPRFQQPLAPTRKTGKPSPHRQPDQFQNEYGYGHAPYPPQQMHGYPRSMNGYGPPMNRYGAYGEQYPPYGHDPYQQDRYGGRQATRELERRPRRSGGNMLTNPISLTPDHRDRVQDRDRDRDRDHDHEAGHGSQRSTPDIPLARARAHMQPPSSSQRVGTPTTIKTEPRDEPPSMSSYHQPSHGTPITNYSAPAEDMGDMGGDEDSAEYLEAQIALAEANAQKARMRLALMAKQRQNRGGNPNNPLNLD